jgi:hypothetical protein
MYNGLNGRRVNALSRLEKQLKANIKPNKVDNVNPLVELTEKDVARIKAEVETLKKRLILN